MSTEITPRRRTALPTEPGETFYRRFAWVAVNLAARLTKQDWQGAEKIPHGGGILIVSNHISDFDPVALGHFVLSGARRYPRFIGKAELWKVPVIGWLARGAGQIPVVRNSAKARDVVPAAAAAIRAGKCVCIYPEGTITAEPDTWPMTPRTGAARIALETGCPVIPVGQWGANFVMPGKEPSFPRLFPRKTMHMLVGDPVDLSDLAGQEVTHERLVEAGDRIMDAITALVEQIRGEKAPALRYDIRTNTRVQH